MASFKEFKELSEDSFSLDEISCLKETKSLLLTKYELPEDKISTRELLISCMNCKLRPDNSAQKYKKWIEAMSDFNITSFDDIWAEVGQDGIGLMNHRVAAMIKQSYCKCGRDLQDRSIMWIRSSHIQVEDEQLAIKASVIYYTAIHADLKSLREGITFVIDTSNNNMEAKIGNESKLQRTWQSIPLRPQRIFILGAGYLKRLAINLAISIASLFTSEKVIQRIRFAELEEVRLEVAADSLPAYIGGGGEGGRTSGEENVTEQDNDIIEWVKMRLENFPKYPLEI